MDKIAYIKLSKGMRASVDPSDLALLSRFKWYFGKNGYAVTAQGKYYMHRLVNNTPPGMQTDHINGDKLDNRSSNLRTVTPTANGRNRDKNKNNTSGYKGITWVKSRKKWLAHIKVNYKLVNLGRFERIEDAILSRRNAEVRLWMS